MGNKTAVSRANDARETAGAESRDWPRLIGAPARRLAWGVTLATTTALGAGVAQAVPDDLAVACDNSGLEAYWPGQSSEIDQAFCQLLLFPTATLATAEDFNQRIVEGSSSDSRRASANTMTLPSLWWNRDILTPHLGGRRLVQSWISYEIQDSSMTVVDVLVNPQMWSVLTYTERYAVLNQFGTAARDFGYNMRFFQGNARTSRLVGLYACEFNGRSAGKVAAGPNDTCAASLDMGRIAQVQRNLVANMARSPVTASPAEASMTAQNPED